MKISARMLSRLIREAVNNLQAEPNSAIVSFAVKKFEGARSDMEQLNRFTPFSRWYKGEHGQVRTALLKSCRELMLALKTSTSQPDIALKAAIREYYDYVSSKGAGGSQHEIGRAIRDWWTAKST